MTRRAFARCAHASLGASLGAWLGAWLATALGALAIAASASAGASSGAIAGASPTSAAAGASEREQAKRGPRAQAQIVPIAPGYELSGQQIVDTDGDGREELLLVAQDGRVRTWQPKPKAGGAAVELGELTLPDPSHTLLAVARIADAGYLVAESPSGTTAYPFGVDGRLASEGTPWIPRGKFNLRLDGPTFTSIVQDVNRDGTSDVVVPTLAGLEIWLASVEGDPPHPTFRKAATVSVEILRWGSHEVLALSDVLESSYAIPNLSTSDVNGDGRPDLVVEQEERRAFHLQRADGSFPVQPDVQVDLSIFRDTTEKAELALGGTLTVDDRASYTSRDLDQDGIPDYVIGHRRKVWVFRGTKAGPQFKEPSAILKTAEDITALFAIELDESDKRPDLLLIKVQIPTLATLLRGLFSEWDVRVRALGYANKGDATFETEPRWQNELFIRLPGIVGLVKNPEKILERFQDLEKRFRKNAHGDVDGDGTPDVLLASEDKKEIEIWFARGDADLEVGGEKMLRDILFDAENKVWDLDRMVTALGSFAARSVALETGGRASDRVIELRDPASWTLSMLECGDFDGDKQEEVVLGYARVADRRSISFDVLTLDKNALDKQAPERR